MRDEFLEAADIDLDKLKNACRLAETDVAKRPEHLIAVDRLAHEIKGYGSNIDYDLLTKFADSLVRFLRTAEVSDDIKTKVARIHVDAMALVFSQQITGTGGHVGKQLSAGLRQAAAKFLGGG